MSTPTPDFEALYLRYSHVMHAVAGSILGGTALASDVEDVVHDTIVSVIERPPSDPVANWEAFLVRATRNKAIDHLRSAQARHDGGPTEEHHHYDQLQAHRDRPEQYVAEDVAERIDDERAGAVLWDKLAELDDRDRRILWEFKALGRPRQEAAREFGISPSRVSQISTQALRTLRDELLKEGFQP